MAGYVPALRRVYILDDHELVRNGLRDLLVSARDIQVVGEGGSAKAAPRAILAAGADVMLLDLQLQDGSGVDVCREVRSADPSVSGLLLTSASDDDALLAAILAGASGYLVKLGRSMNIAWAVRSLRPGVSLIDDASAEAARRRATEGLDAVRPPCDETERQLLGLVIEGRTDRDIAEALGADVRVVTTRVAALVDRLTRALVEGRPDSVGSYAGRHRRPD